MTGDNRRCRTSRASGGGDAPRRNLVYAPQLAYVSGYGPEWTADDDPHKNFDPFDPLPLPTECSSSSRYKSVLHNGKGGKYNYELLPVLGVPHYWVSIYVAGMNVTSGTLEFDYGDDNYVGKSFLEEVEPPANPGEFGRYAAHIAFPHNPTITGFVPTSGPTGTAITVTGTGLHDVGSVCVGGSWRWSWDDPPTITINSDTEVAFTVPDDASTGESTVYVGTPYGNCETTTYFTVTA